MGKADNPDTAPAKNMTNRKGNKTMAEINAAKNMIENVEKCVDYRTDDDYPIRENALFWAEILNAWSNHRQADALERIAKALEQKV